MSLWSNISYAQDISDFSKIIKKHDQEGILTLSVNKLDLLPYQLSKYDYIDIDVDGLEFHVLTKISKTIPSTVDTFKIFFDFKCVSNPDIDIEILDPVVTYSFQLVIHGLESGNETLYQSSLHLDKNISEEDDGDTKFTHPLYHFQFGGKTLSNQLSTGNLLLMSAPRLPHPPMDLFLGIHFILKNYFSTKDHKFLIQLYGDSDYQEIINRAKIRMWNPYFKAFREGNTHKDFTLNNVFPMAS